MICQDGGMNAQVLVGTGSSLLRRGWRHALLVAIVVGSFVAMMMMEKFGQDVGYHDFADRRAVLGIPNFSDVMSNLPFLLVGIFGVVACVRKEGEPMRVAWVVFFTGVGLVALGSAYYHWEPWNGTLVWDRLPMTIGFMGLFVALLGESVSVRLGKVLLLPALLVGFASVIYWHRTDDLRFYSWVQLIPLLAVPTFLVLFRSGYSHQWLLLVALGCYVSAKVAEAHDVEVFRFTGGRFCGHSLKHLLAACGCCAILVMVKKRRRVAGG